MTPKDFLESLYVSGSLGIAAFFIMKSLPLDDWFQPLYDKYPWIKSFHTFFKRAIAFIFSVILGSIPVLASVVMLYTANPGSWRGWVELLFPHILTAFLAGQSAHAVDNGIWEYGEARKKLTNDPVSSVEV